MTNEELSAEVDELRAELATIRSAENEKLRVELDAAKHEAEHYRGEANRNAEVGRKIASDCQFQLVDLRSQLEASTRRESHDRRFRQ